MAILDEHAKYERISGENSIFTGTIRVISSLWGSLGSFMGRKHIDIEVRDSQVQVFIYSGATKKRFSLYDKNIMCSLRLL